MSKSRVATRRKKRAEMSEGKPSTRLKVKVFLIVLFIILIGAYLLFALHYT